jgi:outer membrane protein TolC
VYANLSLRVAAAAIGAFLMASPAAAQAPAPLLTLDDAIAQGIANSRLLKVAALDVDKADDELAALRARRLPTFDVTTLNGTLVAPLDFTFLQGAFGVFPQIGPVPGIDTRIRTDPRLVSLLSVQVGQPLTQLRKIALGERALAVGRRIAEEGVRREEQAVVHDVKRLYYGIIHAQSAIRANQEALALYRELDRIMDEYVAREVVLEGDALQVETALARHEQTGLVLHNTTTSLKEQLNVLLGRDISTDFSVSDALGDAEPDISIAAAQALAVEQRPEVRDAHLKVEQAEYALRLAKEAFVPEISVAFGYVGFYNFEVLPRHVVAVGVQGSWEPWDWGRRKAEAGANARTVEQAKLGVLEAESRVKVDVAARARGMQEARAMLRVADLGRQTAAERLRVALEHFRLQASTERQVLEAQAADAEATLQYQQALADFWTARADFEKALGER